MNPNETTVGAVPCACPLTRNHVIDFLNYHKEYLMKLKTIIFGVLLSGASFYLGTIWSKNKLLNNGAFRLNKSLNIQADPNNTGTLPKGSVIYPYKYYGEISTFIMFINTNNLNSLDPVEFEHKFTVSPNHVYD